MTGGANIARYLDEQAEATPERIALHVPRASSGGAMAYDLYTFARLKEECGRYAHGLRSIGVRKGARVLLMVRPGLEFTALSFALFKLGAVPVLIDPGMGKANLLHCVADAAPDTMVAIPLAHAARLMYPRFFKSVKTKVTVGPRVLWGGHSAAKLREVSNAPVPPETMRADEMAAILFTTGSTGPAKGVVYTHGVFDAQVRLIRDRYGITSNDTDLPAFPLFALFSIAMGMSVVIPLLDPTRPAKADPATLALQINERRVTITFGSPAIWRNVSRWLVENKVKLPTLTRVLMAGAPVAPEIHERLLNHILPPGAATFTPFGATESLPVADISGREVLDETAALSAQGQGTCVGYPYPEMTVRIISINDGPVETGDESLCLPQGEIGEIVVSGPVVTKEYFRKPEATRLAKIHDRATGAVWHRMGDAGYFDEKGRLWFCGRKTHRVVTKEGTLFTIPCEAIFNQHPAVARSALVGLGDAPDQEPVLIVERDPAGAPKPEIELVRELLALGAAHEHTRSIRRVLFHPEFPTDARHNAKIFREQLREWAAKSRERT
ncbi:MAG: AMP-binding protein [Nitrospinae bacterium]|nr:AMP-binding protein [Nitrospinota bacterium]